MKTPNSIVEPEPRIRLIRGAVLVFTLTIFGKMSGFLYAMTA
ncbi:MAG: hypothetical protein AAB839_00230 [Patescibacteria group bacterium]